MSVADVIVVGGGPVGLASAIEARLRGLEVVVIEKRTGPVDKACGEGLMPGAVPMLGRLGVTPVGHELVGVTYSNERVSVSHRFRSGSGLGVRRTELATSLKQRAEDLGAHITHTSVVAISQHESQVIAECADGERIRGKYLIGADGLHSRVANLVGLNAPSRANRRRRFGLRQHFLVAPWTDFIEVFYTPTAEVYVTPISANEVGVAVLGPRNTNYQETINGIPQLAKHVSGHTASSQLAGAGPFAQYTSARTAGRVLLVGDASGYVDAITGEGLRLGFAQAQAAVSCIAEHQPKRYEREWSRVSRDFRVLTKGLAALASSPVRRTIVPLAHAMPGTFGAIVDRLAR